MLVNLTALFLFCAGILHFVATPERLTSHILLGICFTLLGTLQIAIAYSLLRKPTKKLVLFGLLFNTGLLAIWLLTQTFPHLAGSGREPVTLLSGLRKSLELISVELLLQRLRQFNEVEL